jgi:hypothetical protein
MQSRATLVIPIVMLGAGTGWVLQILGVAPGVDWMWTLGLASVGVWALIAAGMKRFGVVVGPFFLAASSLTALQQLGHIPIAPVVPLLCTALGGLLLVARVFPSTNWGVLIPPQADPATK